MCSTTRTGTSEGEGMAEGTQCRPEETVTDSVQPASSPVLVQYIREAKEKARELREKSGEWTRRLTQVHALTMHTAISRKDNDTPAAVTSLHISRYDNNMF